MSYVWMKPAYETRLGNLTAKCVLVLIADQANAEGLCHPSVNFIAHNTEISKRTVLRVIQVFIEIELIAKVDRGAKRTPGIQLNTALLGTDLREEYALCFRAAQGRTSGSGARLRDTEENVSETLWPVSETQKKVSETQGCVSETFPPYPHIGRPAIDPLKTHPYSPQAKGSLFKTPARAEENFAIERSIDAVMRGCGFTDPDLKAAIGKAIRLEADKGIEPAHTQLEMISAWRNYTSQAERLKFKWGARRFFGEGYWSKPGAWPWDAGVLRAQAEANAGRNH